MDEYEYVTKGSQRYIETANKLWLLTKCAIPYKDYISNFEKQYPVGVNVLKQEEAKQPISNKTDITHEKKKPKKRYRTDSSLHKARNQKYFKFIKQLALDRDKHCCTECGSKSNLHIHHLVERKDGGTDDISNLITLCSVCHANKHKGENVYRLMTSQA